MVENKKPGALTSAPGPSLLSARFPVPGSPFLRAYDDFFQ